MGKKFEYKVITYMSLEDIQKEGKDGWEVVNARTMDLVTAMTRETIGAAFQQVLLKRELDIKEQ